jgi:hypothetical protein
LEIKVMPLAESRTLSSLAVSAVFMMSVTASGFALAAENLTPVGALERGMPATVQGAVVRITDEDTFKLKDDTGDVSVYIGWRNRVAVEPGEMVTVEGIVDDDLVSYVWPELYASRIIREDGSVINLR